MSETTLTAEQRAMREEIETWRAWVVEYDAEAERRHAEVMAVMQAALAGARALLADNTALRARVAALEAVAQALTDDCEEDDEEPWVLVAWPAWLALRNALEASDARS